MKKLALFLSALMLLSCFAGCAGQEQQTQAPELLEPVGVKLDTAVVQVDDIYDTTIYSGEVVPEVQGVYFHTDGTIEKIHVFEGDIVKEGDVLVTLDNESLNKQLASVQDSISNTLKLGSFSDQTMEADIEIAQEELAILKESGASAEECAVKEAEIAILKADLKQAKELRNLELQTSYAQEAKLKDSLSKTQIVAPCDGRVVYLNRNSNRVQAYKPIIYIADETKRTIKTELINESVLLKAERISAIVYDTTYDITYVPYDSATRLELNKLKSLDTRFAFGADGQDIPCGEFVVVQIDHQVRSQVLTIPANALYQDGSLYYVNKIVDGQRIRHDVTVGLVTNAKAEIVSGLSEGDVVYVKD